MQARFFVESTKQLVWQLAITGKPPAIFAPLVHDMHAYFHACWSRFTQSGHCQSWCRAKCQHSGSMPQLVTDAASCCFYIGKQHADLMVLPLLLCAELSTLVPTKRASMACCSAETCPSMLAGCWSAVSARLHLTSLPGAKQHVGAHIILASALTQFLRHLCRCQHGAEVFSYHQAFGWHFHVGSHLMTVGAFNSMQT